MKWSWARGSNPHGRSLPVLHRASTTPNFTERNGTIRGPANGRPPACPREGKLGYQIRRSAPEGKSRPTPISPALTSQEIHLSFAFFRVSSRFAAPSRQVITPAASLPFPPAQVKSLCPVARLHVGLCSAPDAPAPPSGEPLRPLTAGQSENGAPCGSRTRDLVRAARAGTAF